METHHHHQQQQDQPIITSPPPPPNYSQASSNSSTSSSYSSPSHEFSFTISLQNPTTYKPSKTKYTNNDEKNYSKSPPNNNNNNNTLVVDLSPADEIFFHGHLLPLHLLSHLPQSPSRSSSNSMDSFTLPIRELLEEDYENPHKESGSCSTSNSKNRENRGNREECNSNTERKNEGKSNNFAFSLLFGLKKGSKIGDNEEKEENHHNKNKNNKKKKKKKKMRFDVIHALKKYLKMVQPMVLFKGKREKFRINGKCSYSYSGNVTPKNNNNNYNYSKKEFIRDWRGQNFSAPASMRTSPTNSGLLVATNNNVVIPSASDHSTMEELQAAIQAAIAHCKNSIAKEEKLIC